MADLRDRLQEGLADRYRVERELGRGGMSTVYLAQDIKHDRPVALKVMYPELVATVGLERFLREVRTTARLQHPHILPVLDSGESAGQLWYTMPYVRGESLRDRLRREGQLPLEVAVDLTRQVALALDYAHREGVVHRDLKPDNILLSDEQALVADFGVAKALSAAGEGQLTETGMAVGTPQYMAPEQAAGGAVDARTDVYALGCVLYEMLTGEAPYTGSSAQAITAKRLMDPVPSARRLRETTPPSVDTALQRALAKAPADRFPAAAAFAQALSSPPPQLHGAPIVPTVPATRLHRPRHVPVLAGVALCLVLLAAGFMYYSRRPGQKISERKMLAVLPFKNLGTSADQYFADGLDEEITSRLASVSGLGVISRTSTERYRSTSKPLKQIGRELGANYVLEGSVRWEKLPGGGSRIRVTPQLIRVADDSHLWADRYDADLADVFSVQSQVAEQVTRALDVALAPSERAVVAAKPTTDPTAHDLYLRGNEYYNRGAEERDLRNAEQLYERAVNRDSTFAAAFAQLSLTHDLIYWLHYDRSEERLAKQKVAAERALRLQPRLADAHLALGYYYYHAYLDYPRALAEFEAARKLQPSNFNVYTGMAVIHRRQGRWTDAVGEGRRAAQLNPLSAPDLYEIALTEMLVRSFPEAEAHLDRAIELVPDEGSMYGAKSLLYVLWRGDTAAGLKAIQEGFVRAGVDKVVPPFYQAEPVDVPLRRALVGLAPEVPASAFGSDTAGYFQYKAEVQLMANRPALARSYLDSARTILEVQAARLPDDAMYHARLGAIEAKLGRSAEAIREGQKAVQLTPVSRDAVYGVWYGLNLARILVKAGKLEAAIDELTYLISVPSFVTRPLLRVDHDWDALRGSPRFDRLVNGT